MGRVFISHSAKDDDEREALDALVARLEVEAGIDVLVDYKRLVGGDEWRQEIHTWMALCQAAIVLFTPNALKSKWVLKEATILTWRRALDPAFIFVPVLLNASHQDLEAVEQYSPLAIDEIQFAKTPEALDAVVERLRDVIGKDPVTPMELWVSRLSTRLQVVHERNPGALQQAADQADVEFPWVGNLTPAQVLARKLLAADPAQLRKAINTLADVIGKDDGLDEIIEILIPTWVNPIAVANVPGIAARNDPPRAVSVSASDSWVAISCVLRAGCGSKNWKIVESNNAVAEEGEADVEQIVREVFADARPKVGLAADQPAAAVQKRMNEWLPDGRRYFAIIPSARSLGESQIRELQTELAPMTVVLLAGPGEPTPAIQANQVPELDPRLTESEVLTADSWISFIRTLADIPAG